MATNFVYIDVVSRGPISGTLILLLSLSLAYLRFTECFLSPPLYLSQADADIYINIYSLFIPQFHYQKTSALLLVWVDYE